jgi:hypothetical protein
MSVSHHEIATALELARAYGGGLKLRENGFWNGRTQPANDARLVSRRVVEELARRGSLEFADFRENPRTGNPVPMRAALTGAGGEARRD